MFVYFANLKYYIGICNIHKYIIKLGGCLMEFVFNKEENKENIKELEVFIEDNKNRSGALMILMQKTQDIFGYLPVEMLELITKRTGTPLSEIYGVATFYSQFSFIPAGENKVNVCLGTSCYIKGAKGILKEVEEELGIKPGETTEDCKFSLIETRCLGECAFSPVFTVNDKVYTHVKKEDIKGILENYR